MTDFIQSSTFKVQGSGFKGREDCSNPGSLFSTHHNPYQPLGNPKLALFNTLRLPFCLALSPPFCLALIIQVTVYLEANLLATPSLPTIISVSIAL